MVQKLLIISAAAVCLLIGIAAGNNTSQPVFTNQMQQYNAACLRNAASGCKLVR